MLEQVRLKETATELVFVRARARVRVCVHIKLRTVSELSVYTNPRVCEWSWK